MHLYCWKQFGVMLLLGCPGAIWCDLIYLYHAQKKTGHICGANKKLWHKVLPTVMKRFIWPIYSLPTKNTSWLNFECQIKKMEILVWESNLTLPTKQNSSYTAYTPVQLFVYFVFTSVCFVWIIIWGQRTSWVKHFPKWSLITPRSAKEMFIAQFSQNASCFYSL